MCTSILLRNTNRAKDGTRVVGPARVLPGRLAVSRSFGDPYSKLPLLGGKPGVITAIPEIKSFKIMADYDFIVLGSDGIFDTLSNKDIVRCALTTLQESKEGKSVHEVCAEAVECMVKNSLMRKTADNVTIVMIAFKAFKNLVKEKLGKKVVSGNKDSKRTSRNFNGVKVLSISPCIKPKVLIKKRSKTPKKAVEQLYEKGRKLSL